MVWYGSQRLRRLSGIAPGWGGFDADASGGSHRALGVVGVEPNVEADGAGLREAETDRLQRRDRDRVLHDPELFESLVAGDQRRIAFLKHA